MKVKRILMTTASVLVLYASLVLCSVANSYSLSDLEGKVSIPIYVKDTGIQTREYGRIFRDDYMHEIRNVRDDFSNYS